MTRAPMRHAAGCFHAPDQHDERGCLRCGCLVTEPRDLAARVEALEAELVEHRELVACLLENAGCGLLALNLRRRGT